MPKLSSICFVTPTYGGDIDQFSMLRRSVNLFAPGIPHFAIVHTEDCEKFRERFREESTLEIIPTADVLPPAVELHRMMVEAGPAATLERVCGIGREEPLALQVLNAYSNLLSK